MSENLTCSALDKDVKFDVITMNPPFIDQPLDDIVSNSTWDEGLHVHKEFFAHAKDYLKPSGRAYISQANFGATKELNQMARAAGYAILEIGKYRKPNTSMIFYAFEVQPKLIIDFSGLPLIVGSRAVGPRTD